ncbi:MAG TPA: ATP-binding protein [Pirellulales bacterium]|nr:ATP-binding protein [Pirellulales bacterium]
MTALTEILNSGESETAEFKARDVALDELAKSVCGMLNQQGGVLLWGVDDYGRPAGLDDAENRGRLLNDFIMGHISPRPLVSISVTEAGTGRVVVVDIPQGADKPYSINREIWVRLGKSTLRADAEASANLVERSATRLDRWEREPMPGFGIDDCDSRELWQAKAEIIGTERFGIDVPADDDELLRRLYLVRSGQFTNATVVLFAREPRAWAPHLGLRVVSYGHDKSGPIGNDATVEGPAVRVLKEVLGILQQRTGVSGRFERGRIERRDQPAYALWALREGLVNAMVHRDYAAMGGDVRVEIFPDHLSIQNPGRLPDGLTADDLKKNHRSHLTNPDIARVFHLRGLMEQLGTGTQKLIAACRELKAKTPVWHTTRNMVSLTLFSAPEPAAHAQLAERQSRFLGEIGAGAIFRAVDYAQATRVSERQARRELAQLEAFGLVERRGRGRATAYQRTARGVP